MFKETDTLVIIILVYAVIALSIIRFFHDFYLSHQIIINLFSLVFFFILYMCFLFSTKRLEQFTDVNTTTLLFGLKLIGILLLFFTFCYVIQYLLFGGTFMNIDNIFDIYSYFSNIHLSWTYILILFIIGVLIYVYGLKKVVTFLITNVLSILFVLFLGYILYYVYIYIFYSYLLFLPSSTVLVTKPTYINKQIKIGNIPYCKNPFNYSFSCWLYINPHPPSSGVSYSQYAEILNFRKNPVISYNNMKNTLKLTLKNNNKCKTILIDRIAVQKWINLIFNYVDGTIDIFIDGEIRYTDTFLISNTKTQEITIGQEKGIDGGICNVQYYKKPLTKNKIDDIYNYFKNNTPPI